MMSPQKTIRPPYYPILYLQKIHISNLKNIAKTLDGADSSSRPKRLAHSAAGTRSRRLPEAAGIARMA